MRITSFIWQSPGFSFRGMPSGTKIVLSIVLSMSVIGNMNMLTYEVLSTGMFSFILIKELLLGLSFGYITQLFFSGIEMAGNFVDFQVGFSMAMAFDPLLKINTSYYGRVYYWITMMIFFLADFHHQVIRTLSQSFELIPVTQLNFPYFGVEGIIRLFSIIFEISLNLAIPLVIVALLAEILLALLSRTVPQINVLILGMPLKILLSIIFIYFFLPIATKNIIKIFPEMLKNLEDFMRSISI